MNELFEAIKKWEKEFGDGNVRLIVYADGSGHVEVVKTVEWIPVCPFETIDEFIKSNPNVYGYCHCPITKTEAVLKGSLCPTCLLPVW